MNAKSATLMAILSHCNPQDKEFEHESQVQSIMHTDEYIELSSRQTFSKHFNELLSECKLRAYSNQQLKGVMEAVPLIPTCLEDIIFSLRNGAGPFLAAEDRPNFLDKSHIEKLSSKLQAANGKNYSNIAPEDFMAIFEPSTVKSVSDFFMKLPQNSTDYDMAIAGIVAGKKYCISDRELNDFENSYQYQVGALQGELDEIKKYKVRRRFKKLIIGIALMFLPLFVSGMGAISSSMVGICMSIELILVIIYWLRG